MVGAMTSHKGIPGDSVKDCIYQWPFTRGVIQSPLNFVLRQLHDRSHPHIDMQRCLFNKHSAPNNLALSSYAFQSSSTKLEVHWRLSLARGACVSANQEIRWRGTRNL